MRHVQVAVVFNNEVVNDKKLSLHGVFTHIKFEHILHRVVFAPLHAVEAYVRTDEVFKLLGRNFAYTQGERNVCGAVCSDR